MECYKSLLWGTLIFLSCNYLHRLLTPYYQLFHFLFSGKIWQINAQPSWLMPPIQKYSNCENNWSFFNLSCFSWKHYSRTLSMSIGENYLSIWCNFKFNVKLKRIHYKKRLFSKIETEYYKFKKEKSEKTFKNQPVIPSKLKIWLFPRKYRGKRWKKPDCCLLFWIFFPTCWYVCLTYKLSNGVKFLVKFQIKKFLV